MKTFTAPKMKFSIKSISSANVTKSAVFHRFGLIYLKNPS